MREHERNDPGVKEIGLRYSKHTGPRFVGAGVTLEFDRAPSFSFTSLAEWPEDRYDAAVRAGILDALSERMQEPYPVHAILKAVEYDPVGSSESTFRLAAHAATLAAFIV